MPAPILVSNATVKVSFGTDAQLGASPTPASPSTAYTCQSKSVRASIQSSTIDLSTLCSTVIETLETRKTGTLEIELYVDKTTGPIFRDKVGFLCKVEIDLDGAGTVASMTKIYNGLVTDATINLTPGEVSTETATITLGAFGFTTVVS
jgi:hypothetical protein